MTTVLLGIDESIERAVAQSETVLDLFDPATLTVHLLHDFEENPEGASVTQVASVKRARERFEEAGVTAELRESSGDPAESILDTADTVDADAICVAGRKRSPAGKALFGSVSQSVILHTEYPVLICSADEE